MRYPKLAGVVLTVWVVLGFSAPHGASAASLSLHPSACVLARNGTPYDAIAGATYAGALFTNSSGASAIAYCPLPLQDSVTQFQVTTTSAATTCTMQRMSTSGGALVIFGTQVGNAWRFTTTSGPGSAVTQVACVLAN